jgi:hypothetical protein
VRIHPPQPTNHPTNRPNPKHPKKKKKQGLNLKQKYLYFWAGLQALLGFPLLLVCIVPFIALADSRIAVSAVT